MADPLASVIKAREEFLDRLQHAMTAAIDEVARLLLDEMRQLTSLTDHTLQDLRNLDHPYSWRHAPGSPHFDWEVHDQTGILRGSLYTTPATPSHGMITASVNSEDEKVWYLLLGTERMRPRDFATAALILKREEIGRIFREAHRSVHDRYRGVKEYEVTIKKLPHDEFPAQLPQE